MAPVIWKVAQRERVSVLSLNPHNDIFSDFRIQYLLENPNVKIDFLYTLNKNSFFLNIFGNLISNYSPISYKYDSVSKTYAFLRWIISKVVRIFLYRFLKVDINRKIRQMYDLDWIEEAFEDTKPEIFIFDHASHPGIYNVPFLTEYAAKIKIPTIDIPHGIPLFVKHPKQWDKSKKNLVSYRKNHSVLHHKWWKDELLDSGMSPENLPILGSPRFCLDWVRIINKITPEDQSLLKYKNNKKLNLVYMEMGGCHDANIEIVNESIKKILDLDFVNFIIKPQTRSNMLMTDVNVGNAYIANNENSVNLVKWADVVLVLFSSIMIEALIQGKTYIYPSYWHSGRMIYADYNACLNVDSYDKLENALRKKFKDKNYLGYHKKNVDAFLDDAIFNNFEQNIILDNFDNYISKIKKERK